jgi:hypothetical protein
MTKGEAITLEALKYAASMGHRLIGNFGPFTIKEALAPTSTQCEEQPVQEPVAWMHEWEDGERVPQLHPSDDRLNDQPTSVRPLVYGDTAPPQRPWVGLTEADYSEMSAEWRDGTSWAEAKLKEKNT